jgi:hypothetical protein
MNKRHSHTDTHACLMFIYIKRNRRVDLHVKKKEIYVFHKNRIRVTKVQTTKEDDVFISGTRKRQR